MDAWVFTRYQDVNAILRNPRRFSNDGRHRITPPRIRRNELEASEAPSMLFLDAPDHTRLRRLVSKAFTQQTIKSLEPRIRTIMAHLLNHIPDPSAFDFMDTIASPLPVTVIAELIGVPPENREQFKIWSDHRARMLEPALTRSDLERGLQAGKELAAYFLRIIHERHKTPQDDLVSALIIAKEAGDNLTENEIVIMLRLFLVAGNETTANLIGNGMLALLRHPDQMQTLRNHPDIMPTAIEELLRYDSPVQIDIRTALEDTDWERRSIRHGQSIVMLIGAANHDPERFDNPYQLDLSRNETSHLSFGRGIHHYLGAALARMEGRIAFEMLLDRFGKIHLLTN